MISKSELYNKINDLCKTNYWNGFYAGVLLSLVGFMIALTLILWILE